MGNSLHNKIYLGRNSVLDSRRGRALLVGGALVGGALAAAVLAWMGLG